MTSVTDRIAQFEKMAREDPDNDMAHFSLGSAFLQAGRAAEAAECFEKCLAINPDMSKAYQLAGEAMIAAGWADKAVDVLTTGYSQAAKRGDRLPQQAIAELLQSIGREPPTIEVDTIESVPSGEFMCQRTGRPGTQLPEPPFRGPVGKWIQENISAQTWRMWIDQGTKVINELRLDFSREEDQESFDQHMREFLGIDDELHAKLKKGK